MLQRTRHAIDGPCFQRGFRVSQPLSFHSPARFEDLRQEGFSETVSTAVACVTHRQDEPYADYVVRCKTHPLARPVKLADLADNSRLDRCILRVERVARDLSRIHRYLLSYKFLTDRLSEQDYRSSRHCTGSWKEPARSLPDPIQDSTGQSKEGTMRLRFAF